MRLTTPVTSCELPVKAGLGTGITVLGSCFADSMGERMRRCGLDVCVNPFGTLYNPASIAGAVRRLDSGTPFQEGDCVEMGAGAGLICSFEHHTSFARPTAQEFLANANARLAEACAAWQRSSVVIITLGTAQVWRRADGRIVSNCLKRPGGEFSHDMLGVEDVTGLLGGIVAAHPGKRFIFTVSPIRHLGEGAHLNTLSKGTLHLGIQAVLGSSACYFPAYEILLDELRDYRFFADDLVHPSRLAEDIIWERFVEAAVPEADRAALAANEKAARREAHRPLR